MKTPGSNASIWFAIQVSRRITHWFLSEVYSGLLTPRFPDSNCVWNNECLKLEHHLHGSSYTKLGITSFSLTYILAGLEIKYGLPVHLYIGPQFRSEEFAHFMKVNGVKLVLVAPHHAAGNGLAERMVQSWTTWRPAKVVNCRFSNVLPTTCWLTGQQGMLPLAEHHLAYSWDESYASV